MDQDYISTRRKRTRYTFGQSPKSFKDDYLPVQNDKYTYFYQICTFPDPRTKKFHMRKFVINGNNEFVSIDEYYLTKKSCKQFFASKKSHEYKMYHTYNLTDVTYPVLSDFTQANSELLNNSYDYSGYAPF